MLGTRSILAIALIAAAVGVGAFERHKVQELQRDNAALALEKDNTTAALDTTRTISRSNAALAQTLGDSLTTMTQRLVVQQAQVADRIDRALKTERIGKYALTTRIDSLERVMRSRTAVVEDTMSHTRRATFDVRQAPYSVAAAVELPAPPDTGRLQLRVSLDPIPVTARLSCAPPNARGIRSASIEAAAPAWASVQFEHVEQSPDLCQSPALEKPGRHWINPAIVVGIGKVAIGDGELKWGAFVGGGLALSR